MKRSGQVTIFIIVGIVLVVGLGLLFFFKGESSSDIGISKDLAPSDFIESCMQTKIQETVIIMLNQGGVINNSLYKKFKFSDETEYSNISLLCYTPEYYSPCINQNPMYITEAKRKFKEQISGEMKKCFENLETNFKKEYESSDVNYNDFKIEFKDDMVILNIDAKIAITKAQETKVYNEFNLNYPTRLYSLLLLAQEISNQQAEYSYFNIQGFMSMNPEYYIRQFTSGDMVKIFRIKHKKTEEEIKFATRGSVIAP